MWPDCSPPSSRLLAPERLEHVAVADVGGDDANAVLAHELVEAEVGHLGDRHQIDAEVQGQDGEDLIAVDRLAGGGHGQHAVAVAVEGDAEVAAVLDDRAREQRQIGRAAAVVDVDAVRRCRRSQLPRHRAA